MRTRAAEVAARAGVERRDEHEVGRVGDRAPRAHDRDVRSSSGWRSASSTGRGNSSSSSRNSTPLCASVISPGRTLGPPPTSPAGVTVWCGARNGRAPTSARAAEQAGDRVDHRRLERLVEGERRQDPGQPPRQHRLPRAGRPDEEQVVAARRRDLQRAPRHLLPAHVAEIGQRRLRRGGGSAPSDDRAIQTSASPRRRPTSSPRCRGACTSHPPTTAASPAFSGGTTSRRTSLRARPGGDRQHAAHRPQRCRRAPARRRTASPPGPLASSRPGRAQHADGDRHVEGGAVLAQVGGRQVDGDPARRQLEAAVLQRAADAHAPLAHARVGQPDDVAAGQPDRDVDLDVDGRGFDPDDGGGGDTREHAPGTASAMPAPRPIFALTPRRSTAPRPPRPTSGRLGRNCAQLRQVSGDQSARGRNGPGPSIGRFGFAEPAAALSSEGGTWGAAVRGPPR